MIKELTSINKLKIIVTFLLIIAILVVYYRVGTFDFITFDDDIYVYSEPHVKGGLSLQNIIWCFTTPHARNWHPLTSISLFINSQVFGMNPCSYHLINLFLHISNTLLLLLVLWKMTQGFWPSLFVAALFALHPIHVESVAWISERKDVLCTFFWLLTMLTYSWYVSSPKIERYIIVSLFLVFSLLAKPMAVTLPFILLLMDYWPLCRFQFSRSLKDNANLHHIILEKLPFFFIVIGVCIITFFVQRGTELVQKSDLFPIDLKASNAIISYVVYLIRMLWPFNLAIFYPYPQNLLLVQTIISGLLLLFITLLALRFVKKAPYFVMGWLWYLGTLVPVIGIVQVGQQASADRYTYIPLIGIFIIIAWGVSESLIKSRYRVQIAASLAVIMLAICAVTSWYQVGYWSNSTTLYTHAIRVTNNNHWAHCMLAVVLLNSGNYTEAIKNYQEYFKIVPDSVDYKDIKLHPLLGVPTFQAAAHINLGIAFLKINKNDEAMSQFQTAIKMNPYDANGYYNIGIVLIEKGRLDEAVKNFQLCVRINPYDSEAHKLLRATQAKEISTISMIESLENYIAKIPYDPNALYKLAFLNSSIGKNDKSIFYFNKLISIQPDNSNNYYNIACIYARQNRVREAIKYLQFAIEKGFHNWDLIKNDTDLASIRNTVFIHELIKNH